MMPAAKACLELVREISLERYLTVLMAPVETRVALAALYGFHHEVARVPDLVSEALPGEIRLQWWRDAIAGQAHGDVGENPIFAALSAAMAEGTIQPVALQRLIDARAELLYGVTMRDLAALEIHLDATASALYRIAGEIVGLADIGHAAHHGGLAEGLTGIIRNLGFDASQGRVLLPQDRLMAHGASAEALFAGEAPAGLPVLIDELLERASDHLDACHIALKGAPSAQRAMFRPLALVAPRIALLRARRADYLASPPELSPLAIAWYLWRNRL